ncbi:Bacterial nodulin-like intrinsic protein [Moraxella ovis]|uniref:Bacterial nodulin-like intrinsic protein n=1 Tax=Moraxella ovis TaxID=29433 RepID=A0A378PKH4_9GAMM|nr:Bacterial nodulin-like intrinsic protein [Moraxella ovis]
MSHVSLPKKPDAEFFGTSWLVFGGCGSAVLAADIPELGIGFAGVSLAFGLTVLTMAYAVSHISGGHFNPAVTLGLVAGGRFGAKDAFGCIGAQVIGGIAAAAVLYVSLQERQVLTLWQAALLRMVLANIHQMAIQ